MKAGVTRLSRFNVKPSTTSTPTASGFVSSSRTVLTHPLRVVTLRSRSCQKTTVMDGERSP